MGYCGGDKEKPDYYSMGDHTEAISIDFDPTVISYSELLGYFWKGHRCDRNNSSTQYMNAIFYRNEEQQKVAEHTLQIRAAGLNIEPEQVATKILPVKEFTYAEKYHQKYALRGELREYLNEIYPDAKSLADSTLATRLNGYLGNGFGRNKQEFLSELEQYNLPSSIDKLVRNRLESLR